MYIREKIVINAVHERGTIVNNRNMMQVKNKKKLLGMFYAHKFRVLSEKSYSYFEKLSFFSSFIRLIILMNHRTAKK